MNPKTLKEHLLSLNEAANTVKIKGLQFLYGDYPIKDFDNYDLNEIKERCNSKKLLFMCCKQNGNYNYAFDEDVVIKNKTGAPVLIFFPDNGKYDFNNDDKIEVESSAHSSLFPRAKLEVVGVPLDLPANNEYLVKGFARQIYGTDNIKAMIGWLE